MNNDIAAPAVVAEKTPLQMAVLAGVLVLLGPAQAFACEVSDPFTIDEFAQAPLVLVGDIIGLDTIPGTNASLMTLRVTERLHGDVPDEVTLFWPGSLMTGEPSVWTEDPHIIVAAQLPRTDRLILPHPDYDDLRPDLPAIIVQICGPDGVSPATDAAVNDIRSAIP